MAWQIANSILKANDKSILVILEVSNDKVNKRLGLLKYRYLPPLVKPEYLNSHVS